MPAKGSKGFASERQREAARRNLEKGNPRAYTKPSSEGATEPARPASSPAPAEKPPTIRARTSSPKRREPSPPAPATTPAAPAPKPQAAPAAPSQKKHFLDDVVGSIFK